MGHPVKQIFVFKNFKNFWWTSGSIDMGSRPLFCSRPFVNLQWIDDIAVYEDTNSCLFVTIIFVCKINYLYLIRF